MKQKNTMATATATLNLHAVRGMAVDTVLAVSKAEALAIESHDWHEWCLKEEAYENLRVESFDEWDIHQADKAWEAAQCWAELEESQRTSQPIDYGAWYDVPFWMWMDHDSAECREAMAVVVATEDECREAMAVMDAWLVLRDEFPEIEVDLETGELAEVEEAPVGAFFDALA